MQTLETRIRREVWLTLMVRWVPRTIMAYFVFLMGLMVAGIFITPLREAIFWVIKSEYNPLLLAGAPLLVILVLVLLVTRMRSRNPKTQETILGDLLDINWDYKFRALMLKSERPELLDATLKYLAELELRQQFLQQAFNLVSRS